MDDTQKQKLKELGVLNISDAFTATSWQDVIEMSKTNSALREIDNLTTILHIMIDNIRFDSNVEDKSLAIKTIVTQYADMVSEIRNKESGMTTVIREAWETVKAAMSTSAINNLPDSAFAYIESGGKKDDEGKTTPRSLRHYPIHDAAHVRNALARAAQAINKGGETANIARKAISKIRAAAKKFGIESKDAFFIVKENGSEKYRFVGTFSNNFCDTDNEIISEAAHKEFSGFLDERPDHMPVLQLWHTPGTTSAKADMIDVIDGFAIVSGVTDIKDADVIKRLSEKHQLGMSHGFFVLERDPSDPRIITKYRTFEVSLLPLENAANQWTSFDIMNKEVVMPFKPNKRAFLVEALGEEKVAELETKPTEAKALLESMQIDSKEFEDVSPPASPTDELAGQISTLSKQIEKLMADFDAIQKSIDGKIEKVTKDFDQRYAEAVIPPVARFDAIFKRPSQSAETELEEDDKLKQSAPSWVAKL